MTTSAAFRATTTCTILRTDPNDPNAVDEYGTAIDVDTPVATGVPISIIQQTVRQFLPSENRYTNVTTHTARLRADVSVEESDRIKDERTDEIYMVEGIFKPQDPLGPAAIRLDLRKAGPTLP